MSNKNYCKILYEGHIAEIYVVLQLFHRLYLYTTIDKYSSSRYIEIIETDKIRFKQIKVVYKTKTH